MLLTDEQKRLIAASLLSDKPNLLARDEKIRKRIEMDLRILINAAALYGAGIPEPEQSEDDRLYISMRAGWPVPSRLQHKVERTDYTGGEWSPYPENLPDGPLHSIKRGD